MSLDPVTAIFDGITTVVNKIWPDATQDQKDKFTLALAELQAQTDLSKGQLEINAAEASSQSVFVAGWRPAVGWCCAACFGYTFVLQPFITFLLVVCGATFDPKLLPTLDWTILNQILLGMLGLGGLRTWEKVKGVTK